MYRYTKIRRGRWHFNPPTSVVNAGLVKRQVFNDGRSARYAIPRLIKIVDDFKAGKISACKLDSSSTILSIFKYYINNSNNFKSLSSSSQIHYECILNTVMTTIIAKRTLGSIKVSKLTSKHCSDAYKVWTESSIDSANHRSRILTILLNYSISLSLIDFNPMSRVKRLKHVPQTEVWTHDQVVSFLDMAFTDFNWRNIGLIALMCYEWSQKPIDIRLLKWTSVDLDNSVVKIKQTTRGATVELPIPDNLMPMLKQQKEDWDWQQYVVPCYRPSDRAYVPISPRQLNLLTNEIKKACNLPKNLHIGNLRKTAIVQMIDSGVDHLQIMSVTGHTNIVSLNPYYEHTLKAATAALAKRNKK